MKGEPLFAPSDRAVGRTQLTYGRDYALDLMYGFEALEFLIEPMAAETFTPESVFHNRQDLIARFREAREAKWYGLTLPYLRKDLVDALKEMLITGSLERLHLVVLNPQLSDNHPQFQKTRRQLHIRRPEQLRPRLERTLEIARDLKEIGGNSVTVDGIDYALPFELLFLGSEGGENKWESLRTQPNRYLDKPPYSPCAMVARANTQEVTDAITYLDARLGQLRHYNLMPVSAA